MTQQYHRIGKQVTNTLPTWYTSIANANGGSFPTGKVFAVGETPGSVLPGRISPPSLWGDASTNPLEWGGSDGNAYYMTKGYGGSVYVPDLGTYGTLIFGSTGEHSLTEQLTSFNLSENNPSWQFYQQPKYATNNLTGGSANAESADTLNADWYYNPTDFGNLPAAQQLNWNAQDAAAGSWYSSWVSRGKPYPFGYAGWVARRPYGANNGSTILGSSRPQFFRYNMPCYIPASMTGTGDGAIIVNSLGTIYGPYNQGPIISGAAEADFFAETWGVGGPRKNWLYAMNVRTKVWQRLSVPIPNGFGYKDDIGNPHSAVDVVNKRIYYTTVIGGNRGVYYADFTNGLSNITIPSSPPAYTDRTGGFTVAYNSIFCAPISGPLSGRKLLYIQDLNNNALILHDLDNNTIDRLSITGLPSGEGYYRMGFDKSTNSILITTVVSASVINCRSYVIPSTPTNTAGYTVTNRTPVMNGNSVEVDGYGSVLIDSCCSGQRCEYIPNLGVIFVPMVTQKALVFKPY